MKQKTIELVNFLEHLINKKTLVKSNQSIILAISGGQDSISLLFIFIQLKNQWNWKLNIIYCNHLWQKDSFYTMLHLFKLAYLLNIPIYLAVTLQKVLTEQKARNWRSLTFQRITGFYLFSVIVTGHSKSDRIETGLFNLFRGSGTQGVGSLNWTKVILKNYFFKLNKTNLKKNYIEPETKTKVLSMRSETNPDKPTVCFRFVKAAHTALCETKTSFLLEGALVLICHELLKKCYKTEKKTLVELDLLKPIVSKIHLSDNQKNTINVSNSINFLKLKQLNKSGITNIIKKFLVYRIEVHFKYNFRNRQNKNIFLLKSKQNHMPMRSQAAHTALCETPWLEGASAFASSSFILKKKLMPDALCQTVSFQTKFLLERGITFEKKVFCLIIFYLEKKTDAPACHLLRTEKNWLQKETVWQRGIRHQAKGMLLSNQGVWQKAKGKDKKSLLEKKKSSKGLSNLRFEKSSMRSLAALRFLFSSGIRQPKPHIHNYPLDNNSCASYLKVSSHPFKIQYFNQLYSQVNIYNFITDLTNTFAYINTNIKKKIQKDNVNTADFFIETLFLSRSFQNEYLLVRPFLSLTRFDLKKICNSWKIPLFPDQSNQKLKYQRNRIRKQILPALRFFFNPQIDTTLYQFIEILKGEQEYMDFLTTRLVNEIQYKKQTTVELETSFINVLPLPIRRKVIKQFLEKILKKNYKFFDVEKFLQQIFMSKTMIKQEDALLSKKDQKKRNEKKITFLETNQIIQQDVLVNLINQKKGRYKIYKLIFFPKIATIFLQSHRTFFIKRNS